MKFSKKDLLFSIITGLITGYVVWRIFEFLNISPLGRGYGESRVICGIVSCFTQYAHYIYIPWFVLVIIVPVLWIIGVNLGYFLGRWFKFFNQFGKFAAIGFTNAAVYFGILNVLIYFSDINKGVWYSVFIAAAFIIGTIHSYFWNKFWVFQAAANKISSGEFGKFLTVSVGAGLVNVGTASLLVNFVNPLFGLTPDQWANMGGVTGSAVALAVSFIGFKLAVFKGSSQN